MTHDLEYKRALAPMEQEIAKLAFEIGELESEIIILAEEFNPSKVHPGLERLIGNKMQAMRSKTDLLLKINLRVFKTRI